MEVLFALLAIGLSIVSLTRSAGARRSISDLHSRMANLAERVAGIEQDLEHLRRGKPSTEAVVGATYERPPQAVPAPLVSTTFEAPPPEPLVPEETPAPEFLAEIPPSGETREETAAGEAEEIVEAPGPEEFVPPPEPVAAPPAATGPTLADTAVAKARGLEEKIAANWLVWVGGVAVALAGVFLVRYAAEQGWLSPTLRCVAGVLFGVALVAAGEVIRRRPLEREIAAIKPDYVPQALTAAGLFAAFASVYLAHAFYSLLPATVTFLLLAAIALLGFALSLLQGQFVAVLGFIGAMGTPALVSTDSPTPWGFFSYLGVIAVASMGVSDRRNWWWLSIAAIVVSFGWTLVWLEKLFTAADVTPIAIVTGVTAGASLLLAQRAFRRSDGRPAQDGFGLTSEMVGWAGLAAGLATIFLLAMRSELAPAAHWSVLAAAAAAVAASRWQPRFDLVLPAICVIAVVAFGLTYVDGIAVDNLAEKALGWPQTTLYSLERYSAFVLHAPLVSAVLFAGGLLVLGSAARPRWVALATAVVPILMLVAGYAEFRNISGDLIWALPAAAVMAASSAAAEVLRRRETIPAFVTGIYVTAAVAAAVLALAFAFDRIWLTIAYSVLLVVLGAIAIHADLPILRRLSSLVGMLVVLRLTVNPDLRGYEFFHPLGMQWVIYGYLLPAAALVIAARLFRRIRDDLTVTVLEGGALLLAVMFVSIEIRIFMTGTIYSGAYELPEMSLQTISWLTAALILCWRHARYPRLFSLWGARLLILAGVGQAIILQLIAHNPVFTGEVIQGYGLINILILALLVPGILNWLIAANIGEIAPPWRNEIPAILRAAGTLLIFAFVTEEVRVFFQGMVITPKHASLLELYMTTLFWLLPAILPLTLTRFGNVAGVRTAALAVMAASVLMIVFGHLLLFNPALTGEEVRGWPILNVLLLGVFLPAAVLAWLSRRLDQRFRPFVLYFCYLILFVGAWLMVKQGFEGAYLTPMHTSLLELYSTTLIWLGLAALPILSVRIASLAGAREAALAVLAVSLLTLFIGHAFMFNPVFDGSMVRGWPVLNTLLLGFIAPAAILAVLARSIPQPWRPWLGAAAYVLLFIGITLMVKQAFQGAYLIFDTIDERESYAYSAVWIVLAIITMLAGMLRGRDDLRYAALAVLVLAVLKVFLLDMSGLGGLWRVASFFGLGISLIGIGWVHQRFIYKRSRQRVGAGTSGSAG